MVAIALQMFDNNLIVEMISKQCGLIYHTNSLFYAYPLIILC